MMDIRAFGGYIIVIILHLLTCVGAKILGQSSEIVLNGTSCLSDNQCPLNNLHCCQGTNFCCPSGYKCCIDANWCCPEDLHCTSRGEEKCEDLTGLRVGPMVGGLIGLVLMTILIVSIIKCCPDYEPEWKKKRLRSTSDSTDTHDM